MIINYIKIKNSYIFANHFIQIKIFDKPFNKIPELQN